MARFKAVFVEHGYNSADAERAIIEKAGGEFSDCDGLPTDETLRRCADANAIMVRRLQLTRERIAGFKKCKMLLRYGVGVDNIDLAAATAAGIIVGHVPVYCQDEVSAHAAALLLACIRKIVSTDQAMRAGGWDVHRGEPIFRIAGKTLGIIGLGTLGQAFAKKFQGWNLRLLACDPYLDDGIAESLDVQLVSLDELLRESDYISLHVPLLPETRHLIRAETLALMKPGAILVNTARGPLVSGADLLQALDTGRLSCAALDVFESEPPPADSRLRNHPRLIISDHIAWYSEEAQIELQERAAREVVRGCTGGLPENIANPEVLEKLGRTHEWQPNHLARWQRRRRERLAEDKG
jgi:D-3-phosphoglycerate dehydrogenase